MQAIETREQAFQTLEGGLPGGKWVWVIVGGILGGIIAPYFRQQQVFGAIVGAIAVLILASLVFESDDFRMYVDNATDQDVLLKIDSFSPIAISNRSQIGMKFKEGAHRVKIIKASDNSDLEHFDLNATKYRDGSGDTISGYYIYNVAAKNRYKVHHVVYTPK